MLWKTALGMSIRLYRTEKQLTLRQVSAKGFMALGHVSDVERGVKEPSSEILSCIANGLDVQVEDLTLRASHILHRATAAKAGQHKQ